VCQGEVKGTPETCNGKDDDCNGAIDDNVPGTGVACSTASDGSALCKPGVVRCIAGQIKCVGGTPFHAPQCTCPPDDCSLPSDGGGANGCPGGSACIGCACRTPCAASEFPCSGTLVCRDGFCVPPECGGKLCQTFEMCVNNTCVDQCTQKTCPTGQVCTKGECVENTCYGKGCPAGQICKMTGCQADPCIGVQCSVDQFCVGGQCVTTCEGVYCPSGKSCQNGACVEDPCGGVICNDGEACTVGSDGKGHCAVDPCQRMSCGLGRVCKAGDCIDDPCTGVRCPGDPALVSCKLGQCQPNTPVPAPPPEDRAAASGGGGILSCAVGGEVNGGQGWLVLAGLLFLWRAVARRRARGAL
jgi:Notch 1